jgi:hypothetical protein
MEKIRKITVQIPILWAKNETWDLLNKKHSATTQIFYHNRCNTIYCTAKIAITSDYLFLLTSLDFGVTEHSLYTTI